MYKKGITLIETVVYLALLAVVSLIFIGNIFYYRDKQKQIAYERELESVKEFIILQCIESSNTKSIKQLSVIKNQIYDRVTKNRVKLSTLEIDVNEFKNKNININNGEITENFVMVLKGDGKIVYKIQNCTTCKRLHI